MRVREKAGSAPRNEIGQKHPDVRAEGIGEGAPVKGAYQAGDEARLPATAKGSRAGGQAHEAGLRTWRPTAADASQHASSFSQVLVTGVPPDFASVDAYAEWAVRASFRLEPRTPELTSFRAGVGSVRERVEEALTFLDTYAPERGSAAGQKQQVAQQAHSFAQVLTGELPPSFSSVAHYTRWAVKESFQLAPGSSDLEQFRTALESTRDRLREAIAYVDQL